MLEDDHRGEAKRTEDHDHDGSSTGDEAARLLQAVGHGQRVVTGSLPFFMDAREHQHLVVHGQAEHDAEHDDRVARIDGLGGEVEQVRPVAPLEHPHQHAEGGGNGEDVHGDGFDGDDHGAHLEEDEEGGGDENEGQRSWQVISDGVEVVSVVSSEAGHQHAVVFTG